MAAHRRLLGINVGAEDDDFDADVIVNRTAEAIISGARWTGKEAVEIEEATVLDKEHGDVWIVLIFLALVGGVCYLLYRRFVRGGKGGVVEQYFELPREKIGALEARLQQAEQRSSVAERRLEEVEDELDAVKEVVDRLRTTGVRASGELGSYGERGSKGLYNFVRPTSERGSGGGERV